ncbi:MAG: RluA family pseudouridine synthase [Roseburia sp.]|nr:RluA family pseudouridine synthase [Roseburia sp.]
MRTKILYEDKELLVIHKPAGLATQTGAVGQSDVVSELKNYLRREGGLQSAKDSQPENGYPQPYLGVVHRLDQPVEGLLVFAKNKKSTSALSKQLQEGGLHKRYYAMVWGKPPLGEGELVDYLYKDKENRARIVTGQQSLYPEAKPARLRYRLLQYFPAVSERPEGTSLLDVEIETGRFHQIRAQMAHAGMPLLGDVKYGTEASIAFGRNRGIKYVALCAYQLILRHPADGREMHFETEPGNEAFAGIAVR